MRLLIGEVIERDDHPVIKKQTLVRVPIRLGEDVFSSGRISNARRDHLIKSLKAFRLLTEVYDIPYVRCCATSAMREATNREETVARAEMESGVHIETIDGEVEADLICNTFWTQDLLKDRNYLYIDVGGGSTELTWLEHGRRVQRDSFRIGTVRSLQSGIDPQEQRRLHTFLDALRAEHGRQVEDLLLQKFIGEKEVIEVVSAKEKDINGLRKELNTREEELNRKNGEL
ncbi:MAG TPA: hypothetical protein PLP28_11680, partial [Flavobacteriales bacterium]|nr:hypothetical protein [Flavobacteriales bacterium]